MANLVNQPTKAPTRKLWAVIIAGGIIGVVKTTLSIYWPDNPMEQYMGDLQFWLEGAIMVAAGYMTRNRA